MDSYLNLRDTVFNPRRTLLAPLLSVVSTYETCFHHDSSLGRNKASKESKRYFVTMPISPNQENSQYLFSLLLSPTGKL